MTCAICGRKKGARSVRCLRCPGAAPVADRLLDEPLPAVILAVDPGASSGWALLGGAWPSKLAGRLSPWTADVDEVCTHAVEVGAEALVYEEPGLGPSMPPKTTMGLGQTIGIWRRQWRLARGQGSRELGIASATWRAGLYRTSQRDFDTDDWKRLARGVAEKLAGPLALDLSGAKPWNGESAEAFLLGHFALRSLDLVDLLPTATLEAVGWDQAAAILAQRDRAVLGVSTPSLAKIRDAVARTVEELTERAAEPPDDPGPWGA